MNSDQPPQPSPATAPEFDYNNALRANLNRVFNERDDARRQAAVNELFSERPIMFEPTGLVEGRAEIAATAGKLLEQFGPTFAFTPVADAVGHHGLATLRWQAGPAGGPVVVTGTDAAEFIHGRIARLWVLLDPPPS